jgi:16S rRNA (cytidine1402-2'-O)-methyltransferase
VTKQETEAESTPRVGCLSVVATPIGNLGDISARARETLAACDCVAAEDTRHSGALLRHFGIDKPLVSLHDHNERERQSALIARLQGGAHIALISDAGTPTISDPGYLLVRAAANAGIRIEAVPGACAAIAALSVAGLPTDRFCFEGFLPAGAAARGEVLAALAREPRTLVFYEAPHRVRESLPACRAAFGAERQAVVAREITKRFESIYRGSLDALCQRAEADADFARGEIVLLIAPAAPEPRTAAELRLDDVLEVLLRELPVKQAASLGAQISGVGKNAAYKRALQLKESGAPGEDPAGS